MSKKSSGNNVPIGHGTEFDIDRLLNNDIELLDLVDTQAKISAAGNLIRRSRVRKRVSQVALAKRLGTTQPFISELERGLGSNGPTVSTLARILNELDDELLIQSKAERETETALLLNAAEEALGEIAIRVAQSHPENLSKVMHELSTYNRSLEGNPFQNTLINGLIVGIYIALQVLPDDVLVEADRAASRLPARAHLQTKHDSPEFN